MIILFGKQLNDTTSFFKSNITFPISMAVITILLAGYGVYKGFFANENLTDPWDDHDD